TTPNTPTQRRATTVPSSSAAISPRSNDHPEHTRHSDNDAQPPTARFLWQRRRGLAAITFEAARAVAPPAQQRRRSDIGGKPLAAPGEAGAIDAGIAGCRSNPSDAVREVLRELRIGDQSCASERYSKSVKKDAWRLPRTSKRR